MSGHLTRMLCVTGGMEGWGMAAEASCIPPAGKVGGVAIRVV